MYFIAGGDYAEKVSRAFSRFETFQAEQTWRELGEPTITLRDYAADDLARHSPGKDG